MADQFVQRQDVGDPLSRASVPQDLKSSTTTINRGYKQEANPVGPVENIFNTLLQASGQTMDAVGKEATRKMEEDKTLQTMRFYQGMAPTDDATVAGYRAHAVLGMQNSVLTQTARLKKEAETFTGTDEEWEDKVRDSHRSIVDTAFASHPDLKQDPDTLKAITTIYGEQVPQIAAARIGAKLSMDHEKRLTDLADNIRLRSDGLKPDEMVATLNGVMTDASDAMQLSVKDREKVLTTLAIEKAKQGDLTYLNYTKQYKGNASTSLFDRDATLQAAEKVGQTVYSQQHQDAVAGQKVALEQRLFNHELTWDQFVAEGQKINVALGGTGQLAYDSTQFISEYHKLSALDAKENKDKPWMHAGPDAAAVMGLGDQLKLGKFKGNRDGFMQAGQALNNGQERMVITDSEMRSMWTKYETDQAGSADFQTDVRSLLKSGQVGVDPFALTQADPTRQKAAVAGVTKLYEDAAEQAVVKLGPTASSDQKNAVRASYRMGLANILSHAQVVNPQWEAKIAVLKDLDIENADKMTKLPQAAKDAIDLYNSLPEGSQAQHTKDPGVAAVLANYKTFLGMGYTEPGALAAAQKAQRSKRAFSPTENKTIDKAAADIASSKANTLIPGFLGGHTNAPDWVKANIEIEAKTQLIAAIKSGATDVPTAANMVKHVWDTSYTQLRNGQLIMGTRATLSAQMAVHPDDLELTFDTYKLQNKAALEAQAGTTIDKMYFDVSPDRGTFTVRAANGQVLTLPTPLNEMKAGRDGYLSNMDKPRLEKVADGIKGAAVKLLDMWNGTPDRVVPKPVQPERTPEFNEQVFRAIAFVENPDRAGYKTLGKTGVYMPYNDNGKQAIGYGHELTAKEVQQGYITLPGTSTRINIGGQRPSQVTEDVARLLAKSDILSHKIALQQNWKGFDELPLKYQGVLLNISYNTGSALPKNWPLLREAMLKGDDRSVRKQMITSYIDKTTSNKIPLNDRARIIADRFGLNK